MSDTLDWGVWEERTGCDPTGGSHLGPIADAYPLMQEPTLTVWVYGCRSCGTSLGIRGEPHATQSDAPVADQ